MKRLLILATCSATLLATGCLHPKIGPHSLPRDRADYSLSLSDSRKEQTLLNIVKFRYVDPPIFVDVGSIISSYTLAPPDPDFLRVRELLREIQESGAVRIYPRVDAKNHEPGVITLRTNNIPPEIQADILALRHLLHLNPEATELKLVEAPLPSNDTELAVQTRSIEELLLNLAADVEGRPRMLIITGRFPDSSRGAMCRASFR